MDNVLLFITGVLSGLIAGFTLSRIFSRTKFRSDGSTESLLQERLQKADDGLKQFSDQFECQSKELKEARKDALDAREKAVASTTQLETIDKERKKLENAQQETMASLESVRKEKENLNRRVGELIQQIKSQETEAKFFEQAKEELIDKFKTLNLSMLQGSRDYLVKTTEEKVTTPFSKQVEVLRKQVEDLSKDSTEKLGALAQSTRDLKQRSEDVQGAALKLTSALRSPNVKGRWGEVNLKRIIEFAGLVNYCDFEEQVHIGTLDGNFRPDCIISIPGSRRLIIDSKAPLDSYLDAVDATDEDKRKRALVDHCKKVKAHIDQLAKKDYSGRLSSEGQVIDGVILFIPIEGALSMALESDPELMEYAFRKKIILTFPTSLIAILKGISMTIEQALISKNVDEIKGNAVELYKRFTKFTEYFNSIGKSIENLNETFNAAASSYQSRLLVQGKRFADSAGQSSDLKLTKGIDASVTEVKNKDEK